MDIHKNNWSENKWFGMANREYISNQQKIIELLDTIDGGRLLDIGCNDGSFTVSIANHIGATEIFGIEINEEIAKKAKDKNIRVSIIDANSSFPFEDSFFDVIIANQIFEHLLNTDGFLKEIHRVLKPDGYVIISTPNLASIHNSIPLLFGMQPISIHISDIQVGNFLKGVETHGHIKVPTLLSLKDIVTYHGFSIENITGVGFYPFFYPLSDILARIFKRWAVFIILKLRKLSDKNIKK